MGQSNDKINELEALEERRKKGTSYLRKQKESQKKPKKRSKRLSAYSSSERAKTNEMIFNFLNDNLDD